MSKRRGRGPNLTEQLCGALIQIAQMRAQIDGCEPAFTWEQSKRMTNKQIRAHFEVDHDPVPAWVTDGIPCNKPWNLTWRLKREHREKTCKRDIPAAAKSKRIIAMRKESVPPAIREALDVAFSGLRQRHPKPKSKYVRRMRGTTELRHDPR